MAYSKSLPLIFSLLDTPAFGGAEQYLLGHLYSLASQKYSVVLATNNQAVKDRVAQENTQRHYPISCIDAPYLLDAIGNWKGLVKYFLSLPHSLYWLVATVNQLQAQSPHIIALLPGFSDRLTFSPFLKWLGTTVLWIEIGPLEPTFKHNWGFPRFLYSLTRHLPDHFITTSLFTKKSMTSAGKISDQDITLVYPSIPLFTDNQIKKLQTKGEKQKGNSILKNTFVITYTGRLATENEVEVLIKAFALLQKRSSKRTSLLIMGDGPDRARFENIATQLGIRDKVLFTGFISEQEKFSWLSVSDIFVFSRAWELDGFGITTIEAMTVGTPVITSDFGPQREIVTPNQTGLRFKPHNPQSLALHLSTLQSDSRLRQRLGRAGLKHVRATFAHKVQFKLMHDIITKYS